MVTVLDNTKFFKASQCKSLFETKIDFFLLQYSGDCDLQVFPSVCIALKHLRLATLKNIFFLSGRSSLILIFSQSSHRCN